MSIPAIVELDNGSLPKGPQFWLDAATMEVRRHCGWHITPKISQTLVLDGPGGRDLLIPSGHVVQVIACTSDGADVLADVDPSVHGILTRGTGEWSTRNSGIVVTVEHGFDIAPDVAGLIVNIASRAAGPAGIVSQNAGPAGVRYATVGGANVHIPLLEAEKEALAPYKLNWGV